jgi:hypothetical protein
MHTERTGNSIHNDAFEILHLSFPKIPVNSGLLPCTCSLTGQPKIDILAQNPYVTTTVPLLSNHIKQHQAKTEII